MDNIKKAYVSTKEFVVRHKIAVAVATTALVGMKVNRLAIREYDDFLEAKGLKEEFDQRFNEV